MSLSAKSLTLSKSAIRDRHIKAEAELEICNYLEGLLDINYWELSQEEADAIASSQTYQTHEEFVAKLKKQGKSRGAIYIASRVRSGANPDLYQLTHDWFAHRNIKAALPPDQLREIGASVGDLRRIGIKWGWEAQRFCNLYREVMVKGRVWGSCYQTDKTKVLVMATTPNYNRLPMWVKKIVLNSPQWVETDRVGNIWRLIPCAKAWRHAPNLPKGIAEKVGKMPVKSRILANWAWFTSCYKFVNNSLVRDMHNEGWNNWYKGGYSRKEIVQAFWLELRRLSNLSLAALINERMNEDEQVCLEDHNSLRTLVEGELGLPYGFIFEAWGRCKTATKDKYLNVIVENGSPEIVCQNLFGNGGKQTVKLFKSASKDAWQWASAVCDGNADATQKVLAMTEIVKYQTEAVDFLKSLPLQSRVRLLGATTFKYRGQVNPISDDHIRDTGYLWKNIQTKPDLGRIRCWFSVHETLAAAYVDALPDEALPIPQGWEKVNGLCSILGEWELEFPRRVATLKYYGQALRNCVGGYGNAIKSGRSVIFVVREQGVLTHCVEVTDGYVRQFYRSGNSEPDYEIKESVVAALEQAKLL